jgi:hypothetical protein
MGGDCGADLAPVTRDPEWRGGDLTLLWIARKGGGDAGR